MISDDDANCILEDVIDTLIEVDNGVTNEHLHNTVDKLLRFKDEWLNPRFSTLVAENERLKNELVDWNNMWKTWFKNMRL